MSMQEALLKSLPVRSPSITTLYKGYNKHVFNIVAKSITPVVNWMIG